METSKINMSNEEYVSLNKEERIELNKKLPWNTWHNFSQENPGLQMPKLPCILNGVLLVK